MCDLHFFFGIQIQLLLLLLINSVVFIIGSVQVIRERGAGREEQRAAHPRRALSLSAAARAGALRFKAASASERESERVP
jgi:hypothetical protein